ncbi:hypothetical protein B0H13DRAFT_2367035 [Mycena leptocephala]|nr:hypothetical protein B0H13DRAFT_2367035 [Mycena leptocephala]
MDDTHTSFDTRKGREDVDMPKRVSILRMDVPERVFILIQHLSKHCAASGGKVRIDKTIDLSLAATAQDFQGKNAAEMAMFLSVMKAKAQGFTHCIAKAISNSAAVLAKNGFEVLAEVDYKMYTFQGMKPFEEIPNFKSAKLMYRSLANFDVPSLKTRTAPKL